MAQEAHLPIADGSWTSQPRQKVIPDDGGRERHRQAEHCLYRTPPGKVSLGEEVAQRDTDDGDDDRRLEGCPEAHRQRIPDPRWDAEPVQPRVRNQSDHADSVLSGAPPWGSGPS